MTKLPMLEDDKSTLEKCVYCPKLCRASCPVSNAHPNETLTPWGKMSTSYFLGRGDLALDRENASPAWACTGCYGCRERCDHRNDVSDVLHQTRAELFTRGLAPSGAAGVASGFAKRSERLAERARVIAERTNTAGANGGVLVGCANHLDGARDERHAIDELAVNVASRLAKRDLKPVGVCCGLPLYHAGDLEGFERAAKRFASVVAKMEPLVGVDPGCVKAVRDLYPTVGVSAVVPKLLIDLADQSLDQLTPVPGPAPRYHDPCQLARGLSKIAEPRRILERIAGAPPREFQRSGLLGECSGAGSILPVTMPEESHQIARSRIDEHQREGGGVLVTACAASRRRFRASGEPAEDIVEWIARSLSIERTKT